MYPRLPGPPRRPTREGELPRHAEKLPRACREVRRPCKPPGGAASARQRPQPRRLGSAPRYGRIRRAGGGSSEILSDRAREVIQRAERVASRCGRLDARLGRRRIFQLARHAAGPGAGRGSQTAREGAARRRVHRELLLGRGSWLGAAGRTWGWVHRWTACLAPRAVQPRPLDGCEARGPKNVVMLTGDV